MRWRKCSTEDRIVTGKRFIVPDKPDEAGEDN